MIFWIFQIIYSTELEITYVKNNILFFKTDFLVISLSNMSQKRKLFFSLVLKLPDIKTLLSCKQCITCTINIDYNIAPLVWNILKYNYRAEVLIYLNLIVLIKATRCMQIEHCTSSLTVPRLSSICKENVTHYALFPCGWGFYICPPIQNCVIYNDPFPSGFCKLAIWLKCLKK